MDREAVRPPGDQRGGADEGAIIRARAAISWGHETSKVKAELVAAGVDEAAADATIAAALGSRNHYFRVRGSIDLIFAVLAFAGATALFFVGRVGDRGGSPILAGLLAAYGCYRLFNGFTRVLLGGRGERAEVDPDRGVTIWDVLISRRTSVI